MNRAHSRDFRIRDFAVAKQVKAIHKFECQVCGVVLEGPAGKYAEGAHIKPLGRPHNGPEGLSNILCLCPNHHVLFDLSTFAIDDDMSLIGLPGKLQTSKEHVIDKACLQYRRDHYSN
jgi:putative restriction endonuclease